MNDILDNVLLTVSSTTGRALGSLSGDTVIESLGLDSLDEVEILMTIEDKLDVTIDQTQVNSCKTLGDLVALIGKAKS